MLTRRELLGGITAGAFYHDDTVRRILKITSDERIDPADESYWNQFRQSFFIPPDMTMFNNAGVNPPPQAIVEAEAIQSRRAATNPSFVMWREQVKELDTIISDLAAIIGCKSSELALTMNASYGLQTLISGLKMSPGDEILLNSEEYPRAFTAAEQRARREGILVKTLNLQSHSESDAALVTRMVSHVSEKTKLVVASEITYLTGRRLPVEQLHQAVTKKSALVLSDAAQSVGIFDRHPHADFHVACLHKWMMGPVGTGFMTVREDLIERIWPLHPADPNLDANIEKFTQVGTHPIAPFLALRESLTLHHRLGPGAKRARLLHLRSQIASQLEAVGRIEFLNSIDEKVSLPFLTVRAKGISGPELASRLMSGYNIHVTTATRAGLDAIRISPNLFTSTAEIKRLTQALKSILED